MLEHEGADLLALDAQALDRRGPSTHEVAHGLVALVGHPHWGEFAGPQQPGQPERVPAIGLHRSPAFLGISEGATTVQGWPMHVMSRCRP